MSLAKRILVGLTAFAAVIMGSNLAWAAEEAAAGGSGSAVTLAVLFISAAFCVSFGAFSAAMAQGKAVKAACEGMARNPGIAPKLLTTMILGLAMIEALAIYCFVVSLILLFANKFI